MSSLTPEQQKILNEYEERATKAEKLLERLTEKISKLESLLGGQQEKDIDHLVPYQGFDGTSQWNSADANFNPENTSLEIMGKPVMERWETPFMHKIASIAASNGGRVLEVGFGLGIASGKIQEGNITEHVIIEANAGVFKRLEEWAKKQPHKVTPMFGLWEDVVSKLEDNSFDGILYDTYPLSEKTLHTHQFDFLKHAFRLLKPGGVLSYCNLTSWGKLKAKYPNDHDLFHETQEKHLRECGFNNFSVEVFNVNPPPECKYYQSKTICAPTIRK